MRFSTRHSSRIPDKAFIFKVVQVWHLCYLNLTSSTAIYISCIIMPLASIYVIEANDVLTYLMDIWNNRIPLPLVSLLYMDCYTLCLDYRLMDYSSNNFSQIVKYFFAQKISCSACDHYY